MPRHGHTTAWGGSIKRDTWNIRIHSFVKEYFKKKGVSPREILEEKYFEMKNNELPGLLKEKEELLKRVAQIDSIVPQLRADCATINSKLDEFCNEYINSRPIEKPDKKDLFWIKCKIKDYNLGVSVDKFLERCAELKGG